MRGDKTLVKVKIDRKHLATLRQLGQVAGFVAGLAAFMGLIAACQLRVCHVEHPSRPWLVCLRGR